MKIEGNGQLVPPAPTIDDYWMAIYRRKGIILLVVIAAAVAAAVISRRIPPQYETKAVFYVPQDVQGSVGIGTNLLGARLPSGLQDHAKAFAEIIDQNDAWRAVHERFPQKPLSRFGRDIDIVAAREGTIEIYVRDREPEVAAGVARALVDYFNEFNQQIILGGLEHSIAQIDEQIGLTDDEIADSIRNQGAFLEQNSIASLTARQTEMERTRVSLQDRLREAVIDQASIEDRIAILDRRLDEETRTYEAGEIAVTSSTLTALQQSLASLEVELAGRRTELTGDHPQVRALERRVEEAREHIRLETARLVESKEKQGSSLYDELRSQLALLYADRAAVAPRIAGLEEAIADFDGQIRRIPELVTEAALQDEQLARLRLSRADMEGTRNMLTTRSLDLRETAVMIQEPATPTAPSYPIVTLNVGVAGVLGLIVGVIYALMLEHGRERRRLQALRNLEVERWAESLPAEPEEVAT
jgi:uncharacterized protein involved in exopolysaccharide biosynthesis